MILYISKLKGANIRNIIYMYICIHEYCQTFFRNGIIIYGQTYVHMYMYTINVKNTIKCTFDLTVREN